MKQKAGIFSLILLLLACSRVSDDEISPVITGFQLNAETLLPGEELMVSVSGTDNEELNQVRFQIEEAFSKSFAFYEEIEIRPVTGRSFSENFNFSIPDSALAGTYAVSVQIVDQRGNVSIDSLRYFRIGQPGFEPVFNDFNTNPPLTGSGELVIGSTDTLTFAGSISDDEGLSELEFRFDNSSGNALQTIETSLGDTLLIFSLQNLTDTVFMQDFDVHPTTLVIKVRDTQGHQNRIEYPMIVID